MQSIDSKNTIKINKDLSLYIDFLRVVSAFLVFLAHLRFDYFKGEWLGVAFDFGVEGVIVFFVISGFVISYAANNLEGELVTYIVNRLSRLFSVVLPFLLLGFVLNFFFYSNSSLDENILADFFLSLFFLNEVWFLHVIPFSNPPYWSVTYEFWYYIIFGVFFYIKSNIKYFYLILLFLLVGPKILLLLPTWLMGVGAYYLYVNYGNNIPYIKTLYYFSLLFFIMFLYFDIRFSLDAIVINYLAFCDEELLLNAMDFLSFYSLGFFVALNLVGFSGAHNFIKKILLQNARLIKKIAKVTFTMYVFHFPLLFFYSYLFSHIDGFAHTLLIFIFSLASIFIIAPLTEGKKYFWRKQFNKVVRSFNI